MPRYLRTKGSVFFFTVVLAERPSNLLLIRSTVSGTSIEKSNKAAHSKPSQSAFCLITFTHVQGAFGE
jgi:hypothetical protein